MKIVSWNVNGIAACRRKGFLEFLADAKPDIVCCQEIKTRCSLNTPGYTQFWNLSKKTKCSGTLTLVRKLPLSCSLKMGIDKFDDDGRFIALEYKECYIINVYVPSVHPHNTPDRPDYRMEWDTALREYVSNLSKPVILCGDFNTTRAWIDSYPENAKNEPDNLFFRSDIREGMEKLINTGLVDVFRELHPFKEGAYTWWGPKNKNRADNRGTRLDYFLLSSELLSSVQSIKFHKDILGSDHCPISMIITQAKPQRVMNDEDLAVIWRTIDWPKMEAELQRKQQDLSYAAYNRKWDEVEKLQSELVRSWAARVLAVRAAANANSQAGIDGVHWKSNEEKAKAALTLTSRGYRPLPYRHTEVEESGKLRIIHVPAVRDKAMLTLYAYSLDPVSEATADRKSFSARKGRSAFDAHAYLMHDLTGPYAPEWVVVVDVQSYYSSITHERLMNDIPMDKAMLQKFLKAGVIRDGELFSTDRGISLGTSLSPILGNMLLDGLQSYIYDRLYPAGGVDYLNGNTIRFADDIIITARSQEQASLILDIACDFLGDRGLRMNQDKSYIADVNRGFCFLSRHYKKTNGILCVTPSDDAIKRFEHEMEKLILNFKGTQRTLIGKINKKLRGWASYHSVEDAYEAFCRVDIVVWGLLTDLMCRKYPRWHRETITKKFWVKEGGEYFFILPTDPTIRVVHLAHLETVRHKPCKLKFNPYLDADYQIYLQHQRDVQKHSGKYRAVWTRQSGRCFYCNQLMLADQDIELIEKNIGQGRRVQNLIYIHRQCAYDIFSSADELAGEHIDLISMLDGIMDTSPSDESPYIELTEYFRQSKRQTINLSFQDIEKILGDALPWEAYCFDAFWYDDTPDLPSPMWRDEDFPFQTFQLSAHGYCISHSWLSQGYKIKALHRETDRVVFRKIEKSTSGYILPKALTDQRLPDEILYKFDKIVRQFIKDYGL